MRPIDADAAVDRYYTEWEKVDICDGAQDRDWLKQCIDEAPTIDPEDLRPHGRWNEINPGVLNPGIAWVCRCSLCGCPQDHKHNYCPNCGAKMIEEVLNA